MTNQWEEAKRLAALAIDAAYAAGCGDCYSQLDVAAARAEGAMEEREACAAICDAVVTQFIDECKSYQTSMGWTGQEAARRIRARSKERP